MAKEEARDSLFQVFLLQKPQMAESASSHLWMKRVFLASKNQTCY